MRPYEAVFGRPALNFLLRCDEDEIAEVETWMRTIERAPHTLGDYVERDDTSRELQVSVLSRVAITYWADDAARELRVCRIESLTDGRSQRPAS